jgi:osmotically-inducible protein OsmY
LEAFGMTFGYLREGDQAVARTICGINAFILGCITAVAIAGAAACDRTARGVKQDAEQAEAATRDERAKAGEAARELGRDAQRTAGQVANAAAEAGEEIAERASAAKTTVDVKTALMADPTVDATRLDVSTDYRTRTVTLNGYVTTAGERDAAEAIAKRQAEGYKVVNNLIVQPRG